MGAGASTSLVISPHGKVSVTSDDGTLVVLNDDYKNQLDILEKAIAMAESKDLSDTDFKLQIKDLQRLARTLNLNDDGEVLIFFTQCFLLLLSPYSLRYMYTYINTQEREHGCMSK
jgi:hypothetical protein